MRKDSIIKVAGAFLVATVCLAGCGKKENDDFAPRLDTEAYITLNVCGFFGNFEALDMVTNDFNEFYPNIEFRYEQIGTDNFEVYLNANPTVNILMNSAETLEKYGAKMEAMCVDLAKADIDFSAVEKDMLQAKYCNGKLLTLPMGQNMYGIVVNESLLKKEGLSVPENYEEFLSVLSVLKEKGYTPLQGPDGKLYAEITANMVCDMLLGDEELYKAVLAGDERAVEKLLPVYEKLNTIIDNGYTDINVNQTYPKDNYDKAILRFFEGDVPFWVCDTEKVSGMKKRESKSESFQANPFDYTFILTPLGEKGVYAFREPWLGFSVNQHNENEDYALEFLRFMATKKEINKMSDIKGIPSIAVEKTDVPIYRNVIRPKAVQAESVNDGRISYTIMTNWSDSVNDYISGKYATPEEALKSFVDACGK